MPTLLVQKLSIQSSYAEDIEQPADAGHFDTVQWWLADDHAWRIKMYAIDGDIHLHEVSSHVTEVFARQNAEKHYGDVVEVSFAVDLPDLNDSGAVDTIMSGYGGTAALEVDRNGGMFAFWNPLRVHFETKTHRE
jgi:hypothetical protein